MLILNNLKKVLLSDNAVRCIITPLLHIIRDINQLPGVSPVTQWDKRHSSSLVPKTFNKQLSSWLIQPVDAVKSARTKSVQRGSTVAWLVQPSLDQSLVGLERLREMAERFWPMEDPNRLGYSLWRHSHRTSGVCTRGVQHQGVSGKTSENCERDLYGSSVFKNIPWFWIWINFCTCILISNTNGWISLRRSVYIGVTSRKSLHFESASSFSFKHWRILKTKGRMIIKLVLQELFDSREKFHNLWTDQDLILSLILDLDEFHNTARIQNMMDRRGWGM